VAKPWSAVHESHLRLNSVGKLAKQSQITIRNRKSKCGKWIR